MQKRQFLSGSVSFLLGAASLAAGESVAATSSRSEQQTVLTLTGAIDRTNRPKIDDALDQLMHKHGVHADRAWALSMADLEQLPQTTIRPTVEYDGKPHKLSGPSLANVLNLAGITKSGATKILFHGIDGYSPEIEIAQAKQLNYVLATRIDGRLMAIGGLGPVFAVIDADRIPELAKLPIQQRFAKCPWGLYCMELS